MQKFLQFFSLLSYQCLVFKEKKKVGIFFLASIRGIFYMLNISFKNIVR